MKKVKDSEGNIFTVISIIGNAVTLRGEAGEKEICFSDLKFYTEL